MSIKRFRKIVTDSTDINRLQDSIREVIDSVFMDPALGGNLIQGVNLSVGANVLSHGLGRKYKTWFIGNASVPARFSTGSSPDASLYVTLVSDAACIADVLVL